MTALLPEQADALREIQAICGLLTVDVVVIGAVAYRIWVQDEHRATEDVDVVVALDRPELPQLTSPLIARGWRQDQRREHRWFSGNGARVDLLPVGEQARRDRRLAWPLSDTTMSLVGFDHVFSDAVELDLAPGLRGRVVPLVVLALLKMVSYLDQRWERRKDLEDVAAIMHAYEDAGERRFSDEVIEAAVDYAEAGSYLLGRDLDRLCAEPDERDAVERFFRAIAEQGNDAVGIPGWPSYEDQNMREERSARQSSALVRGWASSGPGLRPPVREKPSRRIT